MSRKIVEMNRLGLLYFTLSLGVLVVGCVSAPSDEPTTYNVSGTVTLDGHPILEGAMVFLDLDGKQKSYGARIEGGKFSTSMTAGKKKVEITASRELKDKMEPGPSGGPPVPAIEQYIPAKYNKQTILEAEISADSSNKLTFNLMRK